MALTSLTFAAFVLAVIVVYYLVPQRLRWCMLLAGSYVFYLWGGFGAAVYLLFVTAVTYGAGILLNELAARKAGGRRLVVFFALLCNFGLLFLVKYWNFTASAVGFLPQLNLLMPLGISFFIFQSSGYIIDVYREKYPAQKNPLKLALFVSYFPQMVQGPISRYDDLMPKLLASASFDWTNLQFGLQLTAWGLFKKLVIADRAAVLVDAVYGNLSAYGGAMYAVAVLFYCVQLYCDFSGGIDIIRGVSQMLGVELTENFRRPIFAMSLADFWRRWHITLGAWMREYLFYPLCLSKPLVKLGKRTRRRFRGKVGKIIPTSLATFIVYFVVGIWHGANFRYIAFGLYNGVLITAALLLEPSFARIKAKLHIPKESRLYHVFCVARTAVLVFIGRYITRAPRLLTAGGMLLAACMRPAFHQIYDGTLLQLGLTGVDFSVIGLSTALMLAVEAYQERGGEVRKSLAGCKAGVQWAVMFFAIAVLLAFGVFRGGYISSQFIYQGF